LNITSHTNNDKFKKEFEEFLQQKYSPNPEPDSSGNKAGVESTEKRQEIDFDLKPEELEAYLNNYVECQESAIEIIATKIATHYNRMKLDDALTEEQRLVGNIKSNVLLIGPTGVGKTYIVKLIASKIGVPFVKGDATKFSETGYVGGDVEDLIRELVREAEGDIKRAEYGIVYLDEIDKIASSTNMRGLDVSRSGVQRNLLKLMEESEVDLRVPHDMAAQMEAAMEAQRTGKVQRKKVNTRNILFVVSGAFSGLEEIIAKRLNQKRIGFGAEHKTNGKVSRAELFEQVTTDDLVEYGFESEFVGRLPVLANLNELSVDALFNILKNENSSVTLSKKRDFEAYGITVEFDDDALRIFAERAHQQRTGARGLVNILENVLIKFEKKLPSTTITNFRVTKALVERPEEELRKLLNANEIREFQRNFLTQHGIVMEFPEASIQLISEKAAAQNKSLRKFLEETFKDYEYGLKLAGVSQFQITKSVIDDPKKFLDNMVKQSYANK